MIRRSAVALLALTACSFHDAVPGRPDIACAAGQSCPTGYTCRPTIGRCVDLSSLTQPAVTLTNAALAPATGNAETVFVLTFDVTAALNRPPNVYATSFAAPDQTYPLTCGACAPGAACTCTFVEGGAAPPPGAGPLRVWVALVDTLGNAPAPFAVGTLSIDLTPPGLAAPGELTLTPPTGVTVPVTELGLGGSAEVCFLVNEALTTAPPAVWAAGPGDAGVLTFGIENLFPDGFRYCYRATVDGTTSDGAKAILASLEDPAGNINQVTVIDLDGGLVVDTVLPLPPDTSVDGGLVYHRAPWGELPDLTTPVFSLYSAGPAIPQGGTLLAYSDSLRKHFLAQAPVSAGVLSAFALPGPDVREVYVDVFNQAGALAPGGPFPVLNVEWVATLGSKIAGDSLANPNDCYARSIFGAALVQPDDAITALSAPAPDAGLIQIGGAGSWRDRTQGTPPEPDSEMVGGPVVGQALTGAGSPMTYDSAHGLALLMESVTSQGYAIETWTYDGDWHPLDTSISSPTYRLGAGLSFDSQRGVAVYYGGYDPLSNTNRCDTWEWDGATWRNAVPCESNSDALSRGLPPGRASMSLAYDRVLGQTVMLGGVTTAGAVSGDLWAYTGSGWRSLPEDAGAPPALAAASMGFVSFADGGSGLILYGGTAQSVDAGVFFDSTWWGLWNGSTYRWVEADPGTCAPTEPQCAPGLVATGPSGQVVLAISDPAAIDGGGTALWQWNGQDSWEAGPPVPLNSLYGLQITTAARDDAAVMLFGTGDDFLPGDFPCGPALNCVAGHSQEADGIQGIENSALAFDSLGNGVLLGETADLFAPSAAVSLFNGFDWDVSFAALGSPVVPVGRDSVSLTFSPQDQRFWMVGGTTLELVLDGPFGVPFPIQEPDLDSWALDLSAGWISLPADFDAGPFGSSSLAAVADSETSPGLFLSNGDPAETSQLVLTPDAGLWAEPVASQPAAGELVFNDQRGALELVATSPALVELLELDAGQWVTVATGPAIASPSALYDPLGRRVLIGGTVAGDEVEGDLHQYLGGVISRVPLADPEGDGNPADLAAGVAMAFDPARGSVIAYTAATPTATTPGLTWEFREAPFRPGLACAFRFANAEAGVGAHVQSIRYDAQGGADPGGSVLDAWIGGVWVTVAACDAGCPSTGPQPLTYSTANPEEVALMLSDLNTAGVGVTSAVANGVSTAQVTAGPVQATIGYRLP